MHTTRHASRRRPRQARFGAALGLKGAPLRDAADRALLEGLERAQLEVGNRRQVGGGGLDAVHPARTRGDEVGDDHAWGDTGEMHGRNGGGDEVRDDHAWGDTGEHA